MKLRLTILTLFIVCLPTTAYGQLAKLEGLLFDDKDSPVLGVRIIAPGGQAGTTDSKGHFNISFSASVQPGQAMRIAVHRSNWVIYQPMFGNCTTQSTERNFEPLRVVIVPKGSPLALSPKRLGEVIAQWAAERAKLRAQVGALKQNLDEYAFLRQYAEEYGFTLEQFRDAAEQWAQVKESDDKEVRALKEYWQKNYERAAQYAEESAQGADEELRQANKRTREASLKVIRRYKLAGNSYYAQYKFREALGAYNEIEKRFETKELSRENFIAERVEIRLLIANAKLALGARVEGEEGPRLLKEALAEYLRSADFYTREQSPQDWAITENNLGVVLNNLGERVGGRESIKYLNEAVAAYRSALEVRTREQSPYDWAMTQHNLGGALHNLGERVGAAESIKYLQDAAGAFRAALEIRTREKLPQEWAMTQNNLGNALQSLGMRVGGEESAKYLKDAVKAYSEALEVRTRGQFPQEWATTQSNLGVALTTLGERAGGAAGVKYLSEAVAAYRAALEIRTREQSPQEWALTQTNLGNALFSLGERSTGAEFIKYMKEAAVAYNSAIKVVTREHLPQAWAKILTNFGNVASLLGEKMDGAEGVRFLGDAVTLHRLALDVVEREQLPQLWAVTQDNLANALSRLSERVDETNSIKHLSEAVAAYRAVLEVIKREQFPQQWAKTHSNLGSALLRLGQRVSGPESVKYLNEAVAAYRAVLEVMKREQMPDQWAMTHSNLGFSLTNLAARVGGPEGVKYVNEAVAAYRSALEVITPTESPALWPDIKFNLAIAYFQLGNMSGAVESYMDVLRHDPDNWGGYLGATRLYQHMLLEFDKAFLLNQQWLARHPDDLLAQVEFAERHFTTGRFAEGGRRIDALLTNSGVSASDKTALRAIGIAGLLADGKASLVPVKIDELIAEVTRQPADFKVAWEFKGTRHFIGQNERLSPHRAWLGKLLDALASKDRDTMLKTLMEVREKFKQGSLVRLPLDERGRTLLWPRVFFTVVLAGRTLGAPVVFVYDQLVRAYGEGDRYDYDQDYGKQWI